MNIEHLSIVMIAAELIVVVLAYMKGYERGHSAAEKEHGYGIKGDA